MNKKYLYIFLICFSFFFSFFGITFKAEAGGPQITPDSYRWRNDDGNESTATWAADQNTALSGLQKDTNIRLRFRLGNRNGAVETPTNTVYQYTDTNPTEVGVATIFTTIPVNATTEAFQMASSCNFTNGENTNNLLGIPTDRTFFSGLMVQSPTNLISSQAYPAKGFTENEFCIKATNSAINGHRYYFKINTSNSSIDSPTYYPSAVVNGVIPTDSYWVGGTGNWSDSTNHWALTSGGTPTSDAFPGATTNVHFDSNSGVGTSTVNSNATVANIILDTDYPGIVSLSGSFIVTGTATFTNGTFAVGASTLTLSGDVIATSGIITSTTGTVIYNGANQSIISGTYSYLSLSGSGIKTFSDGITINQTLTLNNVSTAGITPTYGTNAILRYNGTSHQTTSSVELPSSFSKTLQINNANGVTLSESIQISAIRFQSGNLAVGTNTLIVNGPALVYSGTIASDPTGSVAFNLDGDQSIPGGTYGNLTLGSDQIKTLKGNTTINGTLTIDAQFEIGSYTLTLNGPVTGVIRGNVDSTVIYGSDSDQTITSAIPAIWSGYGNLTISGSGTKTLVGNTNVAGSLNILGGTFNADTKTLGVTGLTTINGGTYLPSTAEQTLTGGLNFTSGTITQSTGAVNLGNDLTITSGAGTTFTKSASGLLKFKSGTTTQKLTSGGKDLGNIQISANTTNTTLTLQDNLNTDNVTIDANQTLDTKLNSNYAINVAGNWANSGTFTARNGTVIFDGTNQTISGTNNFFNFTAITPDQIITFPQSTITSVTGAFLVEGSSGHNILLKSSEAGDDGLKTNRARLDITATADNHGHNYIQYATIYDNDASHGTSYLQQNCTNGGNNLGWYFNVAPNTPQLVSPADGIATTTSMVTLSALYEDSDTGDTGTTNYRTSSSGLTDCTNNTNIVASSTSSVTPDNNENTTWTSSALTPDGTYYWCAQNNDGVLQSAWRAMGSFRVDTTLPIVTSNATGEWHNQGFDVTLTCTDTGGSGCGAISYCTYLSGEAECDPTTPYSNPFAFSTVGDYILRYKAEDLAGNVSAITSDSNHLKVDTTAPTIGDDYGIKDSVWQNTDQTITLSATDSGSGVSWIKYCTDSISCTPATVYDENNKPVISISKGTIYFRYNAQDNAGNTQSIVTRIVKIDKTPPSTSGQFQNTTKVTNVINNVTERIANIISPAPAIHNNLGNLPPVEQAVPKKTPLVFLNNWEVVPVAPLKNFLVSLPENLQSLTKKFPQLVKSFENISDGKPINLKSLSSASFKLPTLSETLTFGNDLKFNNLSVALPLDKMEKKQLAKIPSEVVFVRSSNQKIDYGVNFTLDSNENVRPRIEITVNKPIQLSVKPDKPVTSVDGYFVLMKTNAKPLTSRNSLVAAAAMSDSQPSSVIKKGTTVSQFQYEKADNGLYTSDITTPSVDGEYKIVTVLNYQDPNLKPKEIEMSALIDPEGYVYTESVEGKARLSNASVSLYWLNPATNTYELWPASDYSQYNPQITDDTGKYSFLVPTGNYYLIVDKEGYKPWKSEIFSVQSGSAVYQNIEMKKESWVSNLWSWVRGKK